MFQSHAGSIEGFLRQPQLLLRERFNPTLVRLRSVWDGLRDPRLEFQSHAGSIEAILRMRKRGWSFPFQSHAGSIEEALQRLRALAEQGFNPTLVRLRQADREANRPLA